MLPTLTIKRPVTVKAVVTEALVRQTVTELQDSLRKAEAELQHLEQHGRRLLDEMAKQNPSRLAEFRQQMTAEKAKREEARTNLLESIKKVSRLKPGEEIVQGTVDGVTEIRVGDRWEDICAAEIVVKDGVVVEIRYANPKAADKG
ncbi:MAG: YlqD family protein [bacterium]|jgi:hypothetical protein